MKKDAIANNKRYLRKQSDVLPWLFFSPRCQSLTEDASAQCACWINQTRVIDKIKEFKCQAKSTQKKVTQFKVIILRGAIHFIIWINRISALTPSKSVKRRRTSLWSLSTSACTTTAWSLSTKLLSHWVRWKKSLHSYLILIKLETLRGDLL